MPLCQVYIGSPRNVGPRNKRGCFKHLPLLLHCQFFQDDEKDDDDDIYSIDIEEELRKGKKKSKRFCSCLWPRPKKEEQLNKSIQGKNNVYIDGSRGVCS